MPWIVTVQTGRSGESEPGANIIFIEKHASYPASVFLTKMNALLPVTNYEMQLV